MKVEKITRCGGFIEIVDGVSVFKQTREPENYLRIDGWLEITERTPIGILWDKDHTKEEAYELYETFKNQPERSKREDGESRCGALNSMET